MQSHGINGIDEELDSLYKNPAYKYTKELCFTDMIDEPRAEEKQSIMFLLEPGTWKRLSRNLMRSHKVDECTAHDIMMDVYIELSRKEDYQLMWDEKDPTKLIPIEGYIHSIINICAKRFFSKQAHIKYSEISNCISTSTGNDEDLFDFIPDESSLSRIDNSEYDLDLALNWARCHRYSGSCDILTVIYARLLAHSNESFKKVLRLMGINKEAERKLESWIKSSDDALYFITSVVNNKEDSLDRLGRLVYGAKLVKRAVELTV